MVTYGHGLGVVVATGTGTEIGRISELLETVEEISTPLTHQLLGGQLELRAAAHHQRREREHLADRVERLLRLAFLDEADDRVDHDHARDHARVDPVPEREGLAQLYRGGESYRGCGVIAAEISPMGERSLDLFGNGAQDEGKERLMAAVNALNKKYGNHTVTMLAATAAIKRKRQSRFRLPMFEAH